MSSKVRQKLLAVSPATIDRLLKHKRAKAQLKGTTMLGMESMSNRMMRLGSGELYFREYMTMDQILKKIDLVTVDDVRAVAEKLFRPDNFSTIIISPSGRKSPGLRKVA